MVVGNPVKEALARGDVAVGTMVFEFTVPALARIAEVAGADFVLYDMEHTGLSTQRLATLVATTIGTTAVPIVRVPRVDYQLMSRPLEIGVRGLMVPSVESRTQAEEIVRATKYPPLGQRGTAFGIAHDGYQKGDPVQVMRAANEATLLIAQIETVNGVENVAEIAAVDGIDVLWIGHNDLTTSMGIPGQFDHPDYVTAVDAVLDACRANGKVAGFRADSVRHGSELVSQGFRCLAYLNDIAIYRDGLRAGVDGIRAAGRGQAGPAS